MLRGYESLACKALRSLGFVWTRATRLAASADAMKLVAACLSHPLPAIREAALTVLRDMLVAQEQRAAVLSADTVGGAARGFASRCGSTHCDA
jgi:hypothetical protein